MAQTREAAVAPNQMANQLLLEEISVSVCKLMIKARNLDILYFNICCIQKCHETRDIPAGILQKIDIQNGRQN